jgi:hypothetical protein
VYRYPLLREVGRGGLVLLALLYTLIELLQSAGGTFHHIGAGGGYLGPAVAGLVQVALLVFQFSEVDHRAVCVVGVVGVDTSGTDPGATAPRFESPSMLWATWSARCPAAWRGVPSGCRP